MPLSRRALLALVPLACATRAARAAPAAREIFADPAAAALAEAVVGRNPLRAAELVAAGASPNARGERNVTLLQWAMLNKSHSGFGILLNLGADPAQPGLEGDSATHFAAKANDTEYLRVILQRGSAVDVRNARTGRTPLMEALMGGRTTQIEMLLAAGASLSMADFMGNTPLHVAAQIGDSAQVLAFLQRGAPPRARNRQGKTFQTYIFMTPERVLNASARQARAAITAWLAEHGIPLEQQER